MSQESHGRLLTQRSGSKQKLLQNVKQKMELTEMQECTFRPQINSDIRKVQLSNKLWKDEKAHGALFEQNRKQNLYM